jgi:transposase
MQVNQLRGLLYEFGAELPKGQQRGTQEIPNALAQLDGVLPAMVIEALRQQLERLGELDRDIAEMERGLAGWTKKDAASRRLMDIPGVGLLTATAAVATIGDARGFKIRSRVCRLAGTGAATERHRWTGETSGY